MRQGELRALRWCYVRFAHRTLVVVAGISAGYESSTKSGKWRAVPLTREAFVALDELSQREWFTGPDDFVFRGPAGDSIDDSALRRRYNAARDAAGPPKLPFHHLRHTFATPAIRGLDPAPVQMLLGHSKITTTERYLHARPLNELAERMEAIFAVTPAAWSSATRRLLKALDRLLELRAQEPPGPPKLAARQDPPARAYSMTVYGLSSSRVTSSTVRT